MEINRFLIESALLTHGLVSISNQAMEQRWPVDKDNIVWMEAGRIVIGGMDRFLSFRSGSQQALRIDCTMLEQARREGLTGALTASGTMAVCKEMGLPLAVTCGMGGIGNIAGEQLCPDLPALAQLPVALIATSPKDMLDIQATMDWLREHGVAVLGWDTALCTGYIFRSVHVNLDGYLSTGLERSFHPFKLLLNPIPEDQRVRNLSLLEQGVAAGLTAQNRGGYYHPAVNGEIDRLTDGYSSLIQLKSLINNALLAEYLTKVP